MTQAPDSGVAAVDRAIAVLRSIARNGAPITLADMARATGFYKSTLLRLLASLERSALVVRRNDGRYALGPYAHELGRAYEATYRVTAVLRPILSELVEKGTESASFHVYHDQEYRACLLRIDSHHSTLDRIDVGDLLPIDRGAAGKLIKAFAGTGLAPSQQNLLATSIGERDPNCAAVAAAVFGSDNEFMGAISLSGPKERFTKEAVAWQSELVTDAAKRATEMLGGRWPTR
ncbi:MAG TPA: helix-turn-helix domain-containing protein [Burkholderiaceae bacterium]|nr:helix-turn-helix domain-containing protein [Burkholderiaceae bacterium]